VHVILVWLRVERGSLEICLVARTRPYVYVYGIYVCAPLLLTLLCVPIVVVFALAWRHM